MLRPPDQTARRVRARLTQRYVAALVVLALAATVAEGVLQTVLARVADDSTEVYLAGRQRMLSQRIALGALAGDTDAAAADVREWTAVHRALLDGDPARDLPGLTTEPTRAMLDSLTDDIERVGEAVGALGAARAAGDAAAARRAQASVAGGASDFLPAMDRVVATINAESHDRITDLRALVLAVWVLLIVLVLVLAHFVFRPAVERVVTAMHRVATQGHLLQTVIDTIPDHIYVKDRRGRATLRNTASAAAMGFDDPADTLGLTDADAGTGRAPAHAPTGHQALQDDLAVVDSMAPIIDKEEPDGAGGWLLTTKVPFQDADGEVVGIVGVSRDITTRKATQQALEKARETAEAAIRSRETFLANVSHEMRTPLHAVLGLSRLLAAGPVSASQADLVTGISRAADTLLVLINDLLDRARLDAGESPFRVAPFFLQNVLDDVRHLLTPVAAEKGVTVEVTGPDGVDTLLGDGTRLRQIVLNLGGNAVKFTDAGGVRVTAAVEDRTPESLTLRIAVEDTGIGIPADQQERIFEAFVQAEAGSARAHGGTGLGLSIVRDLVERQGGTIGVESVEGEGSRFTVRIPYRIAPLADHPEVPPPATEAADLIGLHVLLVEDNPTNRLIARHQAATWGMTVTEAASGQEALDAVAAGTAFDLVLMDIQMPGMDGIEATRRIRAAGRPDLPVVALTASALDSRRGALLEAGFTDFVLKPFDPADLRHRLGLLLGRVRPGPADTDAIDQARLRESATQDPDLERQLADVFTDEVRQETPRLFAAATKEDWDGLRQTAHLLKGQAAYLGATTAVEALGRVETLGLSGGPVPDAVEATADAMSALADAVWTLRVLYPPVPAR